MNPTAQEFFEDYLTGQAALHKAYQEMSSPVQAKFFSAEYLRRIEAWRADQEDERFERAEVLGPAAKMFTVRRLGTSQMRHRYQLRLVEEKWEIHAHGSICFLCQGTGRHDEKTCKHCHGEGWNELFKDRS